MHAIPVEFMHIDDKMKKETRKDGQERRIKQLLTYTNHADDNLIESQKHIDEYDSFKHDEKITAHEKKLYDLADLHNAVLHDLRRAHEFAEGFEYNENKRMSEDIDALYNENKRIRKLFSEFHKIADVLYFENIKIHNRLKSLNLGGRRTTKRLKKKSNKPKSNVKRKQQL